jgi:hypothetical protein
MLCAIVIDPEKLECLSPGHNQSAKKEDKKSSKRLQPAMQQPESLGCSHFQSAG